MCPSSPSTPRTSWRAGGPGMSRLEMRMQTRVRSMCTEPGNARSAGPCCRHSHPRAQGPLTMPLSCLPVPPSLPSVRLHRSLCPRLQGVRHRQGHPDTPGLREGLRAARWGGYRADSALSTASGQAQPPHTARAPVAEHLPWRDVSGPAVLCPASTILLGLPVPSCRLVPVWEWSTPW